jgi:hypothetical protein
MGMTSGVKKTSEGIELSASAFRALVAFGAFLVMLAGFGAKVFAKSTRIDHAVQQDEFRDTTRAIRSDMQLVRGDIRALSVSIEKTSRTFLALQCRQTDYPAGFCDDVPRSSPPAPSQAGKPRRTP